MCPYINSIALLIKGAKAKRSSGLFEYARLPKLYIQIFPIPIFDFLARHINFQ